MYLPIQILISLLASIVLLFIACMYVFILHFRAAAKKKKTPDPRESEIIDRAHARAQHIIDRAVEHSEETLYQTEFLKQELVKHGEESIQQVVDRVIELLQQDGVKYDQDYKKLFELIRSQYIEKTNEAVEKVQEAAQKQLEEFHESVKAGTLVSQQRLDGKVKEEFSKAQKEIAEYKVAQFKKIDRQITGVVQKVVEDTVGHVISVEDHEKMILDALEEAKQEMIFKSHLIQPEIPETGSGKKIVRNG